ncbi:HK97 gp10 family phage protein [Glutamicibacter sp.]|uniref:HK97 gp10 family phage protein n=1 Tax=Glutamicibacter sp. TaxID=1931995 RepID=UPI002B48FD0D|nr:HK97 gp10 family phage protein [Glutamicibacter sp.]HJX79138.1 HK97 gp10 family phage protein [Glutamicibacter sp.]
MDENIKLFNNISLGLQNHQIGEIINWVCAQVAAEAQSKAPVVTGTLRDSITHWMNNELSGEVGAMVDYAAAVEFGYTNRAGKKVPGRKYFTPAAIHGQKMLLDELLKYTVALTKGGQPKPPHAEHGSKGGARAHKFLYKVQTGAGTRYVYGKKTQTKTSFRQLLRPSGRKQKYGFPTRRPGAKR